MATVTAEPKTAQASEEKGLKANAIGFVDALVIGLASTAPAYSLAAVIGSLVVVVGAQAPGALLASFVPMFFIATAFYYMNRADPDAGTTFSWVTRALGPWAGFMGGWAVCTTGILVIGSLELVSERPVPALLHLAGERDARLIVVGTYGESPLRGAIVGSVPHKLLQVSETPVLVVPHTAARAAVSLGG